MIFVTIGTQEPFDRMLKVINEIAKELPEEEFVAQINDSKCDLKFMTTMKTLDPMEFDKLFGEAKLIISHAGMGTIISALVQNKPILVFPRLTKYHEHRNDHQIATAKKLNDLGYVNVAFNESELKEKAANLIKMNKISTIKTIGQFASQGLLDSLKNFISE